MSGKRIKITHGRDSSNITEVGCSVGNVSFTRTVFDKTITLDAGDTIELDLDELRQVKGAIISINNIKEYVGVKLIPNE